MRTDDFWLIVQQTRRDFCGDAPALAGLTTELLRLGEPAISAFEQQVREQMARLDTSEVRDVFEQLWVLSEESWLHFRAWCVSQGRDFVTRLLAEPSPVLRSLADEREGPFDVPNGELFLYCAEYARIARTRAVA